MVEDNGQVLGRLAVMDNKNYQAYRGVKAAFFGFLEMVEDQQVTQALFSQAFDWARDRAWRR